MHRSLVLGALLLGCTAAEPTTPANPTPARTPPATTTPPAPTPPTSAPPVVTPPPVATPTPPPAPLAGHRDIHPIGDPTFGCVEMYSACSPDPKGGQQCTSARYDLDCGKTGQAPGGDKIRCVCP